ncbi:MAG: GAF domain-containing protein [candidate division Zixibacteria bacterium]
MTDEYLDEISQNRIVQTADDFIKTASSTHSALEAVVGLLHASVPYYDWVGIYFLTEDKVLKLGPYRGEESPHREIHLEHGVCGAAAREKQTIIVGDVNADPRYLACSLETKSEIVVPVMKGNSVKAVIDIDSDRKDAFTETDKNILETIAANLSELF